MISNFGQKYYYILYCNQPRLNFVTRQTVSLKELMRSFDDDILTLPPFVKKIKNIK